MSATMKVSHESSTSLHTSIPTRTVVVMGGSYGGSRAAQLLAEGLPQGWRLVLVDRNSHMNHVYNFSRYAVLAGHEHKAFIPYINFPSSPLSDIHSCSTHVRVQATITSIDDHRINLSPNLGESQHSSLEFDYAIYALGSHLPSPIDLWSHEKGRMKSSLEPREIPTYGGTKSEGTSSLRERQERVGAAASVLVVGGGALGIQFATDIAAVYPQKRVTLLHSRHRLLPKFDDAIHEEALQGLQELNVRVILGERLDFESLQHTSKKGSSEPRVVRTLSGQTITADLLLLCTGQVPNTELLRDMDPRAVATDTGLASVLRTMQLCVPPPLKPHKFQADNDEDNDDDVLHWLRNFTFDIEEATGPSEFPPSSPSSPSFVHDDIPPTSSSPRVPYSPYSLSPSSSTDTLVESDLCQETLYPNIFVVGDAADAFNAIKAGHTAYYQAEVAARNILRLIHQDGKVGIAAKNDLDSELEEYAPGPPAIKVTLGMTKSVYEVNGIVGTKNDGVEDLDAAAMWAACGIRDVNEEDMFA
ncbi:FAD/NAD(P)-binding domain-containing protein [Suillus subalutaceus]|uniref:FAD/NAD(P)-binding domain-containing protein n=1 Tax=Suillus subalutaceus TaxID=48586 RepID=UPI001B871AC9|nr:FAD/NAD(P)-binding domain-containing protein [Suillus subalutaceus]KAG1868385.1 FAD/NAD(P)-binding domain-containing protein [Suillus subalutaceus]